MRQEQKTENILLAKHGHRNVRLASHQPHRQNHLSCEAFVLRGTAVLLVLCSQVAFNLNNPNTVLF